MTKKEIEIAAKFATMMSVGAFITNNSVVTKDGMDELNNAYIKELTNNFDKMEKHYKELRNVLPK